VDSVGVKSLQECFLMQSFLLLLRSLSSSSSCVSALSNLLLAGVRNRRRSSQTLLLFLQFLLNYCWAGLCLECLYVPALHSNLRIELYH
jgi:hypothetical protein